MLPCKMPPSAASENDRGGFALEAGHDAPGSLAPRRGRCQCTRAAALAHTLAVGLPPLGAHASPPEPEEGAYTKSRLPAQRRVKASEGQCGGRGWGEIVGDRTCPRRGHRVRRRGGLAGP